MTEFVDMKEFLMLHVLLQKDCPGGQTCNKETCSCETPPPDSCFDGYNFELLDDPSFENFTLCLSTFAFLMIILSEFVDKKENFPGDNDMFLVLYKKTNAVWKKLVSLLQILQQVLQIKMIME